MSNRLFCLVPQANVDRIRNLRASRRISFSAAGVATVAIAILGGSTWLDFRSREMLATAQKEGAPVIKIEQELAALRADEAELAKSLALQRSLGVTLPANGVVRAVADSLPEGALVRSLSLEFQNVQGSTRRQRRGASKDNDAASARSLHCVIEGIAADDSDVGALVEGLSRLPSFSKVTLESSRSYEFRGKNAREYKITFNADLERRWKMPQVASAPGSGEEKP
jgi:hypothetical protein